MPITVDSSAVQTKISAYIRATGKPRGILKAGQTAIRQELRRHFIERDKTPNKLGGERSHLWRDIRDSTVLGPVSETSADVRVGEFRFPLKVFGGVVTAKNPWKKSGFKLLTIPNTAQAYNRRAATLAKETGLKLFFMGNASGGVIASKAEEFWGGDEGDIDPTITVHYTCTPSAKHLPDAKALPPASELSRVAVMAVDDFILRELNRVFVPKQPGSV